MESENRSPCDRCAYITREYMIKTEKGTYGQGCVSRTYYTWRIIYYNNLSCALRGFSFVRAATVRRTNIGLCVHSYFTTIYCFAFRRETCLYIMYIWYTETDSRTGRIDSAGLWRWNVVDLWWLLLLLNFYWDFSSFSAFVAPNCIIFWPKSN